MGSHAKYISFLILVLGAVIHDVEGGKIVVFQFGSPLPNSHFMVMDRVIEELASRNQTIMVRQHGKCNDTDLAPLD